MSLSSHASASEGADEEPFELIKADYGQDVDSPVRSLTSFPREQYHDILEGIYKSPNWVAYPDKLGEVIEKIAIIEGTSQRLSAQDAKMLENTITEVLPDMLPKIFDDSAVRQWRHSIQTDIFSVCLALNQLVIVRLKGAAGAKRIEVLLEMEQDLMHLLPLLALSFDPTSQFQLKNKDEDVPDDALEIESAWAHSVAEDAETQSAQTADEEIVIAVDVTPQYQWLEYVVNHFGEDGGFHQIAAILSRPHIHNLAVLDAVLAPLAKAEELLRPQTSAFLRKPLQGLLDFIQKGILDNPTSRLNAGQHKETSFASLSSLLEKIDVLLRGGNTAAAVAAEQAVGKVRRELILKLLVQSSFSKHLAAVRETNNLLMKALGMRALDQGNAVRVNIEWMRKNDVVKNLLRANLHQKQYVDQVQKVLKNLTIEGGLQEDHLDLLWNLTEKVDTFEVVKNNIFDMLGDLAQEFNNEQLDSLFSKFETFSARPVTDAMKIMDVMRRFAASDTKGVMAKRVMDLLWSIMMNPEAPTEVSKSPAMTDALTAYAQRKVAVDREVAGEYIRQCLAQIQADSSVSAAMNLLQKLVHLSGVLDDSNAQSMAEDDFSLVDIVIGSLERCLERQRSAYVSQGIQMPVEQSDARYCAKLAEYASFLVSLPAGCRLQISWPHVQRLWEALIEKPATCNDRLLGLQLLEELAGNEGLSAATMRLIIEKKVDQVEFALLAEEECQCLHNLFSRCFQEAGFKGENCNGQLEKSTEAAAVDTGALRNVGIRIIWRMVLDMPDTDLDMLASTQHTLVLMYTELDLRNLDSVKALRTEFIEHCLGALLAAAKLLLGTDQPGQIQAAQIPQDHVLAARRAARSLSLLQDYVRACRGKCMPSAPMHAASFKGNQRRFELSYQRGPPQRTRITCHTNMYIGQLRMIAAAKLNLPAEQVRLFVNGRELDSDAPQIRDKNMPDNTIILIAATPHPISYTRAAKETVVQDELSPTTLLANSPRIFELLLELADFCHAEDVRHNAMRLLDLLPTDPRIQEELKGAFESEQPQQAVRHVLQPTGSPNRPAWLLYVLQALNALLFPVMAAPEEPGGMSPIQKAFICSGGVSVLIETVSSVAGSAQMKGPSVLRGLFSATQVLFGQLLSLSTQISCKSADTPMADSSTPAASPNAAQARNPETSVPEADSENQSSLDKDTLAVLLSFYLNLAIQAGRHWTPSGNEHQVDLEDEQDSAICQDAFQAVKQLLEICPNLRLKLFSDETYKQTLSTLMVESLLNAGHEGIRYSASNFGQRLAVSPGGRLMLLQLLSNFEQADRQSSCCKEYFTLVIELLRSLMASRNEADEAIFGIAEQMLEKLLNMSHTMTAKDKDDLTLQWKLRLLLTLVQILDRRDVGTPNSSNLVHRLVVDYLFPESWFAWNQKAGEKLEPADLQTVPMETISQAFYARCSTPEDRQAALELLQDLMSHNSTNLQEGMELIRKIHLSVDIIDEWRLDVRILALTKRPHAFVGLKNGGATCYMNSIFQQLFMQPSIRRTILSAPEVYDKPSDLQDNVFFQLQRVFAHLALNNREVYTPKDFWRAFKDYDGEELNIREHQDGYEFFTRLQDLVDQQMKLQGQKPAMQLVMGGKFAQQIICKNVNFRSEKEEDFYQISLDVRGKRTLQESLDFYVQGELMEGDNQYLCEDLGMKTDAVKRNCIKVLPHMLVIHLKRFEYDYETMTRGKIKDRFEFPKELDMYNYTVSGLEAREAAEEADADGRESAQETEAAQTYRAQCQYQLKGVVVHSGTAFAGHYYSYIKMRNERGGLADNAGGWFCFDDTNVTPWNVSKLDEDCFGGRYAPDTDHPLPNREYFEKPNSAYLLFYERSEELEPIENLTSLAIDPLPNTPVSEPEAVQSVLGPADPPAKDGAGLLAVPQLVGCSGSAVATLLAVPIPDISKSIPIVYGDVFYGNLHALQEIRLVEREYFRFIFALVKDNSEAPFLPPSSMRRTEASPSNTPNDPNGSSADATPALSTGRDDSVDRAAESLLNFAGQFLLRVYLKCTAAMREDQQEWTAVMTSIMEANAAANRWWMYLIAHDTHKLSPQATPPLPELSQRDIENFLVYCFAEDVSRLVHNLTMRSIANALSKESGRPQRPETQSDHQAVINVLKCCREMLSDPDLLDVKTENKKNLQQFLMLLRDCAELSPVMREYMAHLEFLKVSIQHLNYYEGMKEQVVSPMLELISPLMRSMQAGAALKEGLANPYALSKQRYPQLESCYYLIQKDLQVVEYLMHHQLLRTSESIAELWRYMTWSNQKLTLKWIEKYQQHAAAFSPQMADSILIPVIMDTALIKDHWIRDRIVHFLRGRQGILAQATSEEASSQMPLLKRYQLIRLIVGLCNLHPQVFEATQATSEWLEIRDWLEKMKASSQISRSQSFPAVENAIHTFVERLQESGKGKGLKELAVQDVVEASEDSQVQESESESMDERDVE